MKIPLKSFVVIALICILATFLPLALASQLTLVPIGSTFINNSSDDWLNESFVITDTEFILEIINKDNTNKDAVELHLLVASNVIDDGNFTIFINETEIDISNQIRKIPYDGIGNNGVYPTYYQDVNLNTGINAGETVDVLVKIELNSTRTASPKVHFDAVGLDNSEKVVIKNANSHDATYYEIPEFPTIALPMLSILGLMFILSRKRK
ncbi:MAG: PEF-CTERM sorting domain-containing protein [Methanosarcinaceae archaeon]|nr:PEF-CTERM sorting domain-containing protein [Methanosarcinaceae archaeon]